MKMIKVKNDWTWVVNHAEKMINEDEQLENDVLRVAIKYRIEVDNIIELYDEGLSLHLESEEGEEGEYLSFKDWFYSFYCEEF